MNLNPELREQIDAARAQSHSTRRATVPALEELLYEPLPCLDHGFVRCIDYMGDDSAIVQAARVSYGKGTKAVRQDRGLIRYLMRHRHTSPFEMAELKLHVKLPIFVARQWIRHRTANVNEISARYSVLDHRHPCPRWRLRILPAPHGGKCFVGVDDVGEGHVRSWLHGQPGRRYLLGAENRRYADVLRTLARMQGLRLRLLPIPRMLPRTLARVPGLRSRAAEGEQMNLERYRSNARARRELGWEPRPVDEALREALGWQGGA